MKIKRLGGRMPLIIIVNSNDEPMTKELKVAETDIEAAYFFGKTGIEDAIKWLANFKNGELYTPKIASTWLEWEGD